MKLTRRATLTALGGAALSLPYARPSRAQAKTVNVYMWSDYIGETTVADFEAATGIGVVMDYYASSEEAQAKMLAGSTGYDVVDMAGNAMPQRITAEIFDKLDRSKLPGWGNLDPVILNTIAGYDPGNLYGMPYMWGSVGFTHNLEMIKERLPDDRSGDIRRICRRARLADGILGGRCAVGADGGTDDDLFALSVEIPARKCEMRRRPVFLITVLGFGFAFFYIPILSMMVYSFNASRLATVWGGFSTKW